MKAIFTFTGADAPFSVLLSQVDAITELDRDRSRFSICINGTSWSPSRFLGSTKEFEDNHAALMMAWEDWHELVGEEPGGSS